MRIGNGYDVHRLEDSYSLILGGVTIPYEKGLKGHSDADVLVHAIMDSLLGACGMGDIGCLFPDSAEQYRGISSLLLLAQVGERLAKEGYQIGNIDSIIVAQQPKLASYLDTMKENIAQALKTDVCRINIKATTEEHLGFTGAGEGMAAHAVCLLIPTHPSV